MCLLYLIKITRSNHTSTISAKINTEYQCTEEENAAMMKNSNEAAKAQGLKPIASAGSGMSFAAAAASVVAAVAMSLLM